MKPQLFGRMTENVLHQLNSLTQVNVAAAAAAADAYAAAYDAPGRERGPLGGGSQASPGREGLGDRASVACWPPAQRYTV